MRLSTKVEGPRPQPGESEHGDPVSRASVGVVGDLDFVSAPRLRNCLEGLADAGCDELVLDLERVAFMDSSGLQALIVAARRFESPRRLVLRRPGLPVTRVLEMVGLDRRFEIDLTDEGSDS